MIKRISIIGIIIFTLASCGGGNETKKAEQKDSAADSHSRHVPATATETSVAGDYASQVNAGVIKEDTMKGSPVRAAMATVGSTHVHITYGSPGVKGRTIWGGLVAYDRVWATGAHMATKINFTNTVTVAGTQVAAGDYAFFTIPGREKWILILNKNYDQHLADNYNMAEDVVRVEVTPRTLAEMVQRLTYSVKKEPGTQGAIVMQWERVEVALPFNTNQ